MSKDDGYNQPELTLQRNRLRYGTFSWMGQAPQYDQLGEPNELRYQRFYDGTPLVGNAEKAVIDTLLHYDEWGNLDGILNTFPLGARNADGSKLDDPGNSAIMIRPDQDTPDGGVRELLENEALRRWPDIAIDPPVIEVAVRNRRPRFGSVPSTDDEIADWVAQQNVEVDTGEDGNRRFSATRDLKG
jgi:hypothetical protein